MENNKKLDSEVEKSETIKNQTEANDNQIGKPATLAVAADAEVMPFVRSVSIGDLGEDD